MITAGVDLAAEAKGTALAIIEWSDAVTVAAPADGATTATPGAVDAGTEEPAPGDSMTAQRATLTALTLGVGDDLIAETATRVDKLGIDCALGWPDEFVDFVVAHRDERPLDPSSDGGMDWRRSLAYRETDRRVRARTGRWPLSVSTDRLGLTAMRCAGLLARIAERGIPVDRSGAGRVVEIYPGASLRLWGFVTTNYRTDARRRSELVTEVLAAAPWLEVGAFGALMHSSTDAFDAVIAALATRAAALGAYDAPDERMLARARREGWVALPNGTVDSLAGR
ncbi:DUF429 domain-containing protein [Subtercola boreus]|uniref:Branched-chain amino acid aminotransferase n=1 Tax=Subtercola boreus TaxID=120213 RepID=A0A3E0WDU4_9MICO|nr:DUF429 domain-containing protein [Subtercola boreus]RFA23380.1 branched-chain amino acid aminotransferase [Subtercola boreus]RFA23773.1 branched-chain amino acid aminotransferase [Subtercola boreus]RFA29474.1 branched-chain amino acid aminotransferase [Subtercola boreus]